MSEYLSKEEVKQWRSSLEKITLEEYAARLGKRIEEAKSTKDLADVVLKDKPAVERFTQTTAERLSAVANRAMEVEKRIAPTPFSLNNTTREAVKKDETKSVGSKDAQFTLNKALTPREQRVFDYLLANNGKIVYAKDLADLLELPRDYVYKYIKNLRTKIDGDKLQNADKSGFVLNV